MSPDHDGKDGKDAPDPGTAGGAAEPGAEPGPEPGAEPGPEPAASVSGSIDIEMSGAALPAARESGASEAAPGEPGASGRIAVAAALGESDTHRSRIAGAAKEALDAGVSKLGSGIGSLGEGVSRLGEMSRIPVVGSGVTRLGEGITQVGESLHALPQVARTRRGRLLIRSIVVGFIVVAAWIAVIVGLQLHGNDTPDFRPNAEHILVALGKGATDEVYEQASPRFQEMVRKERFADDMTDLAQTVGKFREITAVNESLVTTGPTGRVGRVSLTVAYEKATCKVSVSLHFDQGRWKLLGIGVELPPELRISQAQREERVKACKDPMDIKHCDVHQAADAILQKFNQGQADQIWDGATPVFQQQEPKAKFVQLQLEHLAALGSYRRIIAVTEAKVIGGTSATFDTLAEFEKASGVRTVFAFYRRSKLDPWRLRSFKIVLPMPRLTDDGVASSEPPTPGLPPPAGPPPAGPPRSSPPISPSPPRPPGASSPPRPPGAPSPSRPPGPPQPPSHLAPRDAGTR